MELRWRQQRRRRRRLQYSTPIQSSERCSREPNSRENKRIREEGTAFGMNLLARFIIGIITLLI